MAEPEDWQELCARYIRLRKCWQDGKIDCRNPKPIFRVDNPSGEREPWFPVFDLCDALQEAVIRRRPLPDIEHLEACADAESYANSMQRLNDAAMLEWAIRSLAFSPSQPQRLRQATGRFGFVAITLSVISAPKKLGIHDWVFLELTGSEGMVAMKIDFSDDEFAYVNAGIIPQEYFRMDLHIQVMSADVTSVAQSVAIDCFRNNADIQAVMFERSHPFNVISEYMTKNSLIAGRPGIDIEATNTDELTERLSTRLDSDQRQAVEAIITAAFRPKAYVVLGPPRSGKTRTLVEAVYQLYKRMPPRSKILICTPRNSDADEMERLLDELIQRGEMVRRRPRDRAPISTPRIVLATNHSSCKTTYFDYIFIEDAGKGRAVDMLIPMTHINDNGCIVMFGDKQQAKFTNFCEQASALGYDDSILERITKFKQYREADPRYITTLKRCYRCDERIMAIPNALFYKETLEFAHQTPQNFLDRLRIDHPVQFVPVTGTQELDADLVSSYRNIAEADACAAIVRRLNRSQRDIKHIAIITCFHAQVKLLEEKVSSIKYLKPICEVATTNRLLRREYDVVIVSTVRTAPDHVTMDFMNDPGRFNETVSRAKSLLFVVGCEQIIEANQLWGALISKAGRMSPRSISAI